MSNASYTSGLTPQVSMVTFLDDSVEITYMLETDVRDGGKAVLAHQLILANRHRQYRDGIEALREAAQDLVADVLGDWVHKEPYKPGSDDEDD